LLLFHDSEQSDAALLAAISADYAQMMTIDNSTHIGSGITYDGTNHNPPVPPAD
jgi:hypothetical protein